MRVDIERAKPATLAALKQALDEGGFISKAGVAALADDEASRLFQLLIRWHEGRALVAAQDVAGLIHAAEVGGFNVRDVSLTWEAAEWLRADCNGLRPSRI